MEILMRMARRAAMLDPNYLLHVVLKNKELQEMILDLNRIGQLYEKGIDSTGRKLSDIGGDYAPATLQIAIEKGRPKKAPDHIDLHDTGEFYESFHITFGEKEFFIEADPLKDDGTNLLKEWGEDVLGLTDESKEILVTWIIEAMRPAVLSYLRGTLAA